MCHDILFESIYTEEKIRSFSSFNPLSRLDLPKLKELKLGDSALMGDRRDHRRMQSKKPCYYANTLTMRNLPNLETIDASWRYFRYIGHVILEGRLSLHYFYLVILMNWLCLNYWE